MRLICATCFFLATAASLQAAERRVITHEDLWLMPRVGAPVISPDGKRRQSATATLHLGQGHGIRSCLER
jgi:hypothetical protein